MPVGTLPANMGYKSQWGDACFASRRWRVQSPYAPSTGVEPPASGTRERSLRYHLAYGLDCM